MPLLGAAGMQVLRSPAWSPHVQHADSVTRLHCHSGLARGMMTQAGVAPGLLSAFCGRRGCGARISWAVRMFTMSLPPWRTWLEAQRWLSVPASTGGMVVAQDTGFLPPTWETGSHSCFPALAPGSLLSLFLKHKTNNKPPSLAPAFPKCWLLLFSLETWQGTWELT